MSLSASGDPRTIWRFSSRPTEESRLDEALRPFAALSRTTALPPSLVVVEVLMCDLSFFFLRVSPDLCPISARNRCAIWRRGVDSVGAFLFRMVGFVSLNRIDHALPGNAERLKTSRFPAGLCLCSQPAGMNTTCGMMMMVIYWSFSESNKS